MRRREQGRTAEAGEADEDGNRVASIDPPAPEPEQGPVPQPRGTFERGPRTGAERVAARRRLDRQSYEE
jgi:hypothetical protein